jgi:hypothetical protein
MYFFPLVGLVGILTRLLGSLGGLLSLLGLLGFLQFPLYAMILTRAMAKQRTKEAAYGLIAFHLMAVIFVFLFK